MSALLSPPSRAAATPDDPDAIVTPPLRRRLRRALPWIVLVVILLVAVVLTFVGATRPARVAWGPDDPSPVGSKAFVQVLRDQGVEVDGATTFAATRDAAGTRSETTIVLVDRDDYLEPARLRRLRGLAAHVVLIEPGYAALDALAPEVAPRGPGSGLADGCRLGGLSRSDRVLATGVRYLPSAGSAADVCLGDLDRGYGLVRIDGRTRVDVVGAGAALQNGHALEHADGAFGLGLLGTSPHVVWYVPSLDDVGGSSALPRELVPGWWPPVAALLALVVVAAAIWRGRRFGPLAVENLPVIVPASETMEGRARLYARASARLHALDALRIGALGRLASSTGLPRSAGVLEVVDAVAAATGRPRGEILALLRDREPASDAELVELSSALAELETATRDATRGR